MLNVFPDIIKLCFKKSLWGEEHNSPKPQHEHLQLQAPVNLRTSWCHPVKSSSTFYIPHNDGLKRWSFKDNKCSWDKTLQVWKRSLHFYRATHWKKGKRGQTNAFVALSTKTDRFCVVHSYQSRTGNKVENAIYSTWISQATFRLEVSFVVSLRKIENSPLVIQENLISCTE